jgi:glyoxylase-like metal-dependent hydrolase (beta-lactamase superfamily II)
MVWRCGGVAVVCAAQLLTFCAAQAGDFDTNPDLSQHAVHRISEHVYAMSGFPNIGIIVGSKGSLVVDTGLGPRNGAIVARQVEELSRSPKLYLVTTHFHPEHASGDAGFPKSTILVRSRTQQAELDRDRGLSIARFASNPAFAPYLSGVHLRRPNIVFDTDYRVDLGDVHVHLFWLGAAHTAGDQAVLVEEDRALFTGDLAMQDIEPRGHADGSSWAAWIAILDKLRDLHPVYVLPDHGAFGGPELIDAQRAAILRRVENPSSAPAAR